MSTDDGLSRRLFLARLSALAAGATGATLLPGVASAATAPPTLVDVAAPDGATSDPTALTVAEAATMIRRGQLTSEELVRACLERIEGYDSLFQAFNLVLADAALARARQLDGKSPRTALHGIPLAIKDNYFSRGVRTTANSFIFADFDPPYDATALGRLETAGGVMIGKTQMGPLATTRATTPAGVITTVNAWAPDHPNINPGGSSTGSATATAIGMALSSVGTQTGGSITAPSNAQGLTGLKPTMGRVSLHGIIPLTFTRDHPGPIARDAMDCAIMLTAMAGPDPDDFRTQGLPQLPDLTRAATPVRQDGRTTLRRRTRIGVTPDFLATSNPETAAARRSFLDALAGLRHATVVEVPLPAEWDLLTGSRFNNVRLPERTEPFREYLRQDLQLFGVSVLNWLAGVLLSGDEYTTGQRAKVVLFQRVMDEIFAACDVVVQTDPVPFDIIGLPEIGFPIGLRSATSDTPVLPIGTILGGQPYAEDRLLEVVAAYQDVTDWHRRRPELPPAPAASAAPRAPSSAPPARLSALEAARTGQ